MELPVRLRLVFSMLGRRKLCPPEGCQRRGCRSHPRLSAVRFLRGSSEFLLGCTLCTFYHGVLVPTPSPVRVIDPNRLYFKVAVPASSPVRVAHTQTVCTSR